MHLILFVMRRHISYQLHLIWRQNPPIPYIFLNIYPPIFLNFCLLSPLEKILQIG